MYWTHPDEIDNVDLQNFLLKELAQVSYVQLDDFLGRIMVILTIPGDQQFAWRVRIVQVLRDMQDINGWIDSYFLSESDEKFSKPISYDIEHGLILEITGKGRDDLLDFRAEASRREKTKERRRKFVLSASISRLAGEYDYKTPRNEKTAKERIAKAIATRRGQQAFREKLLRTYKRCLITGCDAQDALEAAHIRPYCRDRTFHRSNGLLLRADIHTLFDLGFIAVDTRKMSVILAPVLKRTRAYKELDGKSLRFPRGTAGIPDREALDEHRKEAGL